MNVKKSKRGRRKSTKIVLKSIRFVGVNGAGLKSKLFTFKKMINELKPSVFSSKKVNLEKKGNSKWKIILFLNL